MTLYCDFLRRFFLFLLEVITLANFPFCICGATYAIGSAQLIMTARILLCVRMNENMEFPDLSGDDIEWMQESLVKTVNSRIEESKADRKVSKEQQGKVRNTLMRCCCTSYCTRVAVIGDKLYNVAYNNRSQIFNEYFFIERRTML